MINRYEILQFLSQRENGALSPENEVLVSLTHDFRRAFEDGSGNEGQLYGSNVNVTDLNSQEKLFAEHWAKSNGCWISMAELFNIGIPGPCGSESDTYLSVDGFVYKMNNLLHSYDSIVLALQKFILHNIIFPDSVYHFVGFTGMSIHSIFPIVKQQYIRSGKPATQNEIDCYLAAIGFEKTDVGAFHNDEFLLSDLLPKNVLKDRSGDLFVIDAEISLKK